MFPSDRPIFLTGFMGSGKSTLGHALAGRLGWEFCDLDEQVAQHESCTVPRIFEQSGEEHFRKAEWEALQGLSGRKRCVVATGGGLFSRARARRWMGREGLTVWLDVPLEECARRVDGSDSGRPLWPVGDALALRTLFERRRAAYALARIRIAPTGQPDEDSRRLIERIRRASN